MSGITFYVTDLETTGLSPKMNHEIIELSAIRYPDKLQLSRTVKAENPKSVSYDALKAIGKTMDDLKRGCSKTQAMNDFDAFLARDGLTPAHRCIVGHNIYNFDRKFLHHQWKFYNRDFPADLWLDTLAFSKRLAAKMGLDKKTKMKLESALDVFGLKKVGGFHTAKGDTRNTFYLFEHLLKSGTDYLDLIKNEPMRKMIEPSVEEVGDFFDEEGEMSDVGEEFEVD